MRWNTDRIIKLLQRLPPLSTTAFFGTDGHELESEGVLQHLLEAVGRCDLVGTIGDPFPDSGTLRVHSYGQRTTLGDEVGACEVSVEDADREEVVNTTVCNYRSRPEINAEASAEIRSLDNLWSEVLDLWDGHQEGIDAPESANEPALSILQATAADWIRSTRNALSRRASTSIDASSGSGPGDSAT